MLIYDFFHLDREIITLELKFLQSRKVLDTREIQVGDGPYDLFKLRRRPNVEFDFDDCRAVDNKNVEFWEPILA